MRDLALLTPSEQQPRTGDLHFLLRAPLQRVVISASAGIVGGLWRHQQSHPKTGQVAMCHCQAPPSRWRLSTALRLDRSTFANLPQADVGGCAASQWHPVGEIAHQTFAMAKPLI